MILFRELDGAGASWPTWHTDFQHWQVEYFPEGRTYPYPWGLAWVVVPPDGPDSRPMLEYVLVNDECRRRGVGKALVTACLERWPTLYLGAAVTDEGEALLRSFYNEGR